MNVGGNDKRQKVHARKNRNQWVLFPENPNNTDGQWIRPDGPNSEVDGKGRRGIEYHGQQWSNNDPRQQKDVPNQKKSCRALFFQQGLISHSIPQLPIAVACEG